jgi:hypothetical protein
MTVESSMRSIWFTIRINMKNKARYLCPTDATSIRVEQSNIADEMLFVVGGKALGGRCQVCDWRFKRWFPHRTSHLSNGAKRLTTRFNYYSWDRFMRVNRFTPTGRILPPRKTMGRRGAS